MGRVLKRSRRINRDRGRKVRQGSFAGKEFLRKSCSVVVVYQRVGVRNRTVYKAKEGGKTIHITAKALRKLQQLTKPRSSVR